MGVDFDARPSRVLRPGFLVCRVGRRRPGTSGEEQWLAPAPTTAPRGVDLAPRLPAVGGGPLPLGVPGSGTRRRRGRTAAARAGRGARPGGAGRARRRRAAIPPPARWPRPLRPARNLGMEFVRALWLGLALALGPGPAGGHPQPCGVPARPGGSVRLGVLLPRAPAARARVRAALALAPALAPRLPRNLSLELVAAAAPARDPASLARGLCRALAAPGVAAVLAFPGARPELLQLHFLAAAAETPVLSVLRREAREPLGAPVRADGRAGVRARGAPGVGRRRPRDALGGARTRGSDEGGPGTLLGAQTGGPDAGVPGAHGTRTSGPWMQRPPRMPRSPGDGGRLSGPGPRMPPGA